MRCRACSYPLWGLKPGRCPECGTPFEPTDFRFAPGTVEFLCPSCGSAREGAEPDGLPEPRRFECAGCARPVEARDTSVRLRAGVAEEASVGAESPWANRPKLGWRLAASKTYPWSMLAPRKVVRGLGAGGLLSALGFAAAVHGVAALVPLGVLAVFAIVMAIDKPAESAVMFAATTGAILGGIAAWLLVVLPLYALAAHVVMIVTGRAQGYGRTLRAVWYAQGPMVLGVLPVAGHALGLLWSLWSGAAMLAETHVARLWRGVAAMVLPIVLAVALPVGAYFGIAAYAERNLPPGWWGAEVFGPNPEGEWVLTSLLQSVDAAGNYPSHVLMVAEPALELDWHFCIFPTRTALPNHPPLGSMSRNELRALGERLSDGQPFYVVGNLVFCHRGVNARRFDPDMWIAIQDLGMEWPDRRGQRWARRVFAITVEGSHLSFGPLTAEDLAAQNELRVGVGLAPIPPLDELLPPMRQMSPGLGRVASLLLVASDASGFAVDHVLDLGEAHRVKAADFEQPDRPLFPGSTRWVSELDSLTDDERRELPRDEGDATYVFAGVRFCHRGMNVRDWDGALWLMVCPSETKETHRVVTYPIDGRGETLEAGYDDDKLDAQNALRAAYGLPPLPPIEELIPAEAWKDARPWPRSR